MSVIPTDRGHRMVCRFSKPYGEPIAPGGLYKSPKCSTESVAVHRVASVNGENITFELFSTNTSELPAVGSTFFYRGWWVRAAMDAVLDADATWELRAYPDDGSHDHCLFTWETISANTECRVAYWSDTHGWATEQAYKQFVRGDPLHLREPRDA
jgi:hypothetical protein